MSNISRARTLIRDVVLAQRSTSIKKLLLSKDIHGGVRKDDLRQKLEDAVVRKTITYDDLTKWLDDTEGWGDEHIYLYKVVSPDVRRLLQNERDAEERVRRSGFAEVWNADASRKYPAQRKLTAIKWSQGELTFVWHQQVSVEKREEEKDEYRDLEDGHYVFKAFRIDPRRNVTRIVIRPHVAALFLPSTLDPGKEHDQARAELFEEIAKVVDMREWPLYSMAYAIKVLDRISQAPRATPSLRAQETKLSARGGGYVQFASETEMKYTAVAPLQEVRGAVELKKFRGADGEFRFAFTPKQDVNIHLYGGDAHRIRLRRRLERDDVWAILKKIPKRSTREVSLRTGTP